MSEQQRHWLKQGMLFGYPNCCVDSFIQLKHLRDDSPRKLNGTGFVPCARCNITKTEEQLIQEINSNRCKEFKPFKALEPDVEMLYMVECQSTGDYSFITKQVGPLTKERAITAATEMTQRLKVYGSLTRFYITPILDI